MMKSRLRTLFPYLWSLLLLPSLLHAQGTLEMEEEYENPRSRREYFFNLRAYPFGAIPQGARFEAMEYSRNKMRQYGAGKTSTLSMNQWRQRGPYNLGGRIHSIAIHRTDGKTLWAAAANGGVWKSTNRGDSWRPVMDFENSASTGGLAVDPSNPNVIYVGTGEPVSANGDTYNGAGIYKSEDGGESWKPLGLTNVGSVSSILVHPTDSRTLIVSGLRNNGGLYRSVDGGITWQRTSDIQISDLSMNPANPNEILIGTLTRGVFRSTDGGRTVVEANNGIALGSTKGRSAVSFAPSNPQTAYVSIEETVGNLDVARVYKTTDRGASWTKVYDSQGTGMNYFSNSVQVQGYYDNVIAVHPTDEGIVLVGGVTMMRTANGGQNWSPTGGSVHADHHAMEFDPANPGVFYNGNDGGMYRSTNSGSTFTKTSVGLAITQFYAMALDWSKDSLAYGGTQDNGTVMSSSVNSGDVMGGDGFYVVVDHRNSNILYAENPYGTGITMFINGNAYNAMGGLTVDRNNPDAGWSAPLVMDPTNSSVMYNGRKKVWKTVTAGAPGIFWIAASPDVRGNVSAIGVSPVNSETVYAGSDQGTVLVSRNGGEDWEDISYGHGLPNRAVMDFVPSRSEAGTAYVAYAGFYTAHIFKTTDYGQSWTDISNGLPDIPVNALAIHPTNERVIYAGTDIGVFITVDGGATWASYNNGLPRSEVRDMEVNEKSGSVWIATHGRSMWDIDLEETIEETPVINSPAGGEVWAGGTGHVISWNGFTGSSVRIDYSLDDGRTWNRLKNFVGGNVMRWIVFDTSSIEARIRISSIEVPSQVVVSRSFTIERFKLGTVLGATGVPGIPYGIAYDGEYLWATNFEGGTLLKIDATTLSTVDEVDLEIPGGDSLFTDITYYPPRQTLFIHKLRTTLVDDPGGRLYEVTKEGEMVGQWNSPFKYPIGLAWLGSRNQENPYLYMSDRNGTQEMWLVNPEDMVSGSPIFPLIQFNRTNTVLYGPRGAAAGLDGSSIWQIVTDFTGEVLNSAKAYKFVVEEAQTRSCEIDLTAMAASGFINARGIELDPRDSNLWVSDYTGSIYKISSCDFVLNIPPPDTPTDAPEEAAVTGVTLSQNRPNPFAGPTEIRFTLPQGGNARLVVHDMNGTQVAVAAEGRFESGEHRAIFDPVGLPSGVYRYSLIIGDRVALSKTMVYMK